jgi:sterol desaturase/sphingolipid hydroxylase (fatty acid hydroxylase superfamily)
MSRFFRYWFYPLLLIATLTAAILTMRAGSNLQRAFAWFAFGRLVLLFVVEWLVPMRKEWAMTWRSFLRDLKYAVLLGGGGFLVKFAAGWLAIGVADNSHGALSQWPVVAQLLVLALTYEFVQYWQHRISHEARGPVGRFLWRAHVQHHLPKRVYLLMHVVSHPINFAIVMAVSIGVIYGLGVGKDAVFLLNVIMGLQGLISHFNVEIKAGPLNYLLVGTELHRTHHSAAVEDMGNYGVLTPFWDLVFGTFRYRPDRAPAALGVSDPQHYPTSNRLLATLALPFRPAMVYANADQEP